MGILEIIEARDCSVDETRALGVLKNMFGGTSVVNITWMSLASAMDETAGVWEGNVGMCTEGPNRCHIVCSEWLPRHKLPLAVNECCFITLSSPRKTSIKIELLTAATRVNYVQLLTTPGGASDSLTFRFTINLIALESDRIHGVMGGCDRCFLGIEHATLARSRKAHTVLPYSAQNTFMERIFMHA